MVWACAGNGRRQQDKKAIKRRGFQSSEQGMIEEEVEGWTHSISQQTIHETEQNGEEESMGLTRLQKERDLQPEGEREREF